MVGPVEMVLGGFATLEGRLVLTVALFGVLLVAGLLAREVRRRMEVGGHAHRLLNVALAGTVVAVVGGVTLALVSVWEGTAVIDVTLDVFDVENPLVLATRLVVTLLMLVGAYLLTGVIKRFVYDLTRDRTAITQHQTELVFRSTQLGVYILASIIVLGVWQVNLGGLLVGAGFLGIVFGLAARQTLGSLIAGFVLMFARPFEIGDWVQIGEREGIVTEISIVNTRIQTFDGEYAMIPNDVVGSSEVINRTRKGRLRIEVDVGVDYSTDLEHAIDVAEGAMRDVDDVLAVPQPRAVLGEFGDSSILLHLRFWIDKPSARRKWRAQTAVVAAVKSAYDEAGVKIPFPQRELMGRPQEGGFTVNDGRSPVEGESVDRREERDEGEQREEGEKREEREEREERKVRDEGEQGELRDEGEEGNAMKDADQPAEVGDGRTVDE